MAIVVPGSDPQPGSASPAGDVDPPEITVRPVVRSRSILVTLGLILAVLFLLTLSYLAWRALASLLVATFLAMALNPAVAALERRGLTRGLSAATVFLAALVVLGAIGFLVVPPLVGEVARFIDDAPGLIERIDREQGPLGFIEERTQIVDRLQESLETGGAGSVLGFTTPVIGIAKTVATAAFSAFSIVFLTFFMLLDGRRWVGGILGFIPPGARPRWERVFAGIYRTVGGYVTGNLVISVIAGLVTWITLFVLGVPYAVPLAVAVALLDLIPLIGASIATVVVALAALTQGLVPALIVLAVMLVYQQVENHVLQPLVYGRAVKLSGLAVLTSVLIGAELAGVLGALAAIPVGGSVAVIAAELLRWRSETLIQTPRTVERVRPDTP